METTLRSIKVKSYDGGEEVAVALTDTTSVERAIPAWVEQLQLVSRDGEGNTVEWTLQDSEGNLVSPSTELAELKAEESYTLAPDLTPAGGRVTPAMHRVDRGG